MLIYRVIPKSIFLSIANLNLAIKMQCDGCGSLCIQKLNIYLSINNTSHKIHLYKIQSVLRTRLN